MITKENASELSKLANQVRWEKWRKDRENMGAIDQLLEAVKLNQLAPTPIQAIPVETPKPEPVDDSAKRLARVQDELIERMTGNDDAKAVSALAQALKNVREVYHLVTGQAKPGVLKTDQSKRRQPAPQVAIEVDTETTPQPVVVQPPKPEI